MKLKRQPIVLLLLAELVACSGNADGPSGSRRGAGPGGRPGGAGGPGGRPEAPAAAVPVEVVSVLRRDIASFIETNGTLEAENEVDVVARTTGPIVELNVEEGDEVRHGQILARLDDLEHRAALEIARVALDESRLAFERAVELREGQLISPEAYEQVHSAYESSNAQFEQSRIQLEFTEIRAPFHGMIVRRHVQFAQQVGANTPMFRISDFDPLLCPIQVPERDLPILRPGQRAYLTVEPFPDQRFEARVLRIRPVVDAGSGTVRVTLEVRARGLLTPGMFARVFVEVDSHSEALVIPRVALSLEALGDTIYVAEDGNALRREVRLGFEEGDFVEVLSGVEPGETVIVVGQDGLSDGTPIQVLESPTASAPGAGEAAGAAAGAGRVESRDR